MFPELEFNNLFLIICIYILVQIIIFIIFKFKYVIFFIRKIKYRITKFFIQHMKLLRTIEIIGSYTLLTLLELVNFIGPVILFILILQLEIFLINNCIVNMNVEDARIVFRASILFNFCYWFYWSDQSIKKYLNLDTTTLSKSNYLRFIVRCENAKKYAMEYPNILFQCNNIIEYLKRYPYMIQYLKYDEMVRFALLIQYSFEIEKPFTQYDIKLTNYKFYL